MTNPMSDTISQRKVLTGSLKVDKIVGDQFAIDTFEKTEEYENMVCAYITGLFHWNNGFSQDDNPYPIMSLEYCSWLDAFIVVEKQKELLNE